MHQPVLLAEAVAALVTERDGDYVDGTFGRGGHSRKILSLLGPQGRLLGIDKDLQAAAAAAELRESDARFEFAHDSFAQLPRQLRRLGFDTVDGILLDLGVSSPQLDDAERGFSFSRDGPLDMRMDTTDGVTAAEWLAGAPQHEIVRVLRDYGEERFARRIAAAIMRHCRHSSLRTTVQLAQLVAAANPAWEAGKHPATRTFQAIRIHINRELEELTTLLDQSLSLLKPGGRLVIISFHSLEDRLVKRFIRRMARGLEVPRGVPLPEAQRQCRLRALGEVLRAPAREVAANPRARSAVMRVAERLAVPVQPLRGAYDRP